MNILIIIICLIIIVIFFKIKFNSVKEPYTVSPQTDVPKNIFQMWIGSNPIPERYLNTKQTIIDMNPNWKYHFLNTEECENFVRQNYPEMLDVYLNYPYDIQRADAIRYMLLYHYGGIYIDLDFVVQKSFDTIRLGKYETGLLPNTNSGYIYPVTNSFIISKPKSRFLFAVLKHLKKNTIPLYSIGKHFIVMNSTGPFMISKMYDKYKNRVRIFTNLSTRCSLCDIKRNECKPNSSDYIVPIEGNSWHEKDSSFYNFVYCLFH